MLLVVSCRHEDRSARLMDEYEALSNRVTDELKLIEYDAQADSLIEAFIEQAFAMQQEIPGSEAAYAILKDIGYMLSTEQKQQAFAVLDTDSLEAHGLQRYYEAFLAEQRTAVGMAYTDFMALDADGNEVPLSRFVGQTDLLLLDFWASWCGPCRRSMPLLKELLAAYGDRLTIIGVSVDNDREAWLQAVSELGLTWMQLHDANDAGDEAYGITAIPHTVLISREGTILAHNPSREQIEAFLDK